MCRDIDGAKQLLHRKHVGGPVLAPIGGGGLLVWRNESPFSGSAISSYGPHEIRNCTFWDNRGPSTIYSIAGPTQHSEIGNCIVGRTVGGYGIDCAGWFEITCSVLSFNDRGPADPGISPYAGFQTFGLQTGASSGYRLRRLTGAEGHDDSASDGTQGPQRRP